VTALAISNHSRKRSKAGLSSITKPQRKESMHANRSTSNRSGLSRRKFVATAGAVTETVLLGNVAARTAERLLWDHASLKASDMSSAQPYLRPQYRSEWAL